MNILFLSNAYPDFESSYRGIFIKKMATLLQKEGYEITVLTPKIYRKSRYFENQGGIRVYRFPFFARNKLLIEYEKIPYIRMLLYYISGTLFTVYVTLMNRCNLIHVHWVIPTGLIGFWAGKILKKPFIVTIHGSDLRMALEKKGVLRRIFVSVCRSATHIQCVSNVQKEEIKLLGLPEEKISVIPMGVDEAFFEARRNRKSEPQDQQITVLSNRNLLPIYNVSLLIRAIPKVIHEETNIRFIIAGDGPEREDLENEARRLNVISYINVLGQVPHHEMPKLLAEADIYVSTSLYDGTSVSLLEAMAAGSFPVVTDISANRAWIISGKNGFLFPAEDEGALARKIIDAIRDKTLLEGARKENQFLSKEKAMWSACIQKIKMIYEDQMVEIGLQHMG